MAENNAGDGGGKGRVHVYARVRPPVEREEGEKCCVYMDMDAKTTTIQEEEGNAVDRVLMGGGAEAPKMKERVFNFDGVFDHTLEQRDVYETVGKPVLRDVLKGFNGSILAYGQTGSGKTHSLLNSGGGSPSEAGLLPRLVAALFVHIAADTKHVFTVSASMFQIYNEQIDDLLVDDPTAGKNLSMKTGGTVEGLSMIPVKTPDDLMKLFQKGRSNLVYAETKMNKASSRSHAVFQFRIMKRAKGEEGERVTATFGKLTVVDLAGSERTKKSGVTGQAFKEATNINASLLAFGNVVQALASKKKHVPFRDSKLTRILEDSVGGNCKTSLLVCLSPAHDSIGETINTLEFASRAMRIETHAVVNEGEVSINAAALAAEVCQTELDEAMKGKNAEIQRLQKDMEEKEKARKKELEMAQQALEEKERGLQKGLSEKEKDIQKWQKKAEAEKKEHDASKAQFQTQIKTLEAEIGKAKLAATQAEEQSDKLRKKVATLEQQITAAQAAAQKSMEIAQAAADSKELEAAKQEVAELQGQVQEVEKQKAKLLGDMEAMQAEKDALLAEAERRHRAELDSLRGAAANEAEAVRQQVAEVQAEGERRVVEARAEAEAVRKRELAEAKRHHEATMTSLREQAAAEVARLKQKAAEAEAAARTQIAALEVEAKLLKEQKAKEEEEHARAVKELMRRADIRVQEAEERAETALNKAHAESQQKLRETEELAAARLKDNQAKAQAEKERLLQTLEDVREEGRQALASLERQAAQQLASAEGRMVEMSKKHQAEVEALHRSFGQERAELVEEHEKQARHASATFEAARALLEESNRHLEERWVGRARYS
eukprot:jgi/Mesvir1/2833/Mv13924-RA.2